MLKVWFIIIINFFSNYYAECEVRQIFLINAKSFRPTKSFILKVVNF